MNDNNIFADIESTGLDSASSQLVAIGISDGINRNILFVNNSNEEKKVIEDFFSFLSNFKQNLGEPRIITYYGSYYDIPFIISSALHLGVDVKKYKIFPFRQIDVYDIVKRTLKLSKNSMGDICRFLHINKEFMIEGRDMPNFYLKAISGDEQLKEKIKNHLTDDVKTLEEIWKILIPVINVERWEKS